MSVTLTDVWCCSPIVRVRVVLRRTVIDWQKFFHRPIWWPPPDLSKQWFRKQSFVGLLSPGQWNYTQLHHWWCFGVTYLGRGNKFLGLAFPQEMKNSPPLPCYLPNTPSFRLSVYVELLNLRIKAQSPKIQTLDVKMEHAHLQFWLIAK